jgi:alpha-tubulin suppressor-like RCC1 family protein
VRFDDISISKTEDYTFAVARDLNGILYSWGSNTLGQLGLGDNTDRPLPTRISGLKRKHITRIALGSNFAIALGQEISVSAYLKKK